MHRLWRSRSSSPLPADRADCRGGGGEVRLPEAKKCRRAPRSPGTATRAGTLPRWNAEAAVELKAVARSPAGPLWVRRSGRGRKTPSEVTVPTRVDSTLGLTTPGGGQREDGGAGTALHPLAERHPCRCLL